MKRKFTLCWIAVTLLFTLCSGDAPKTEHPINRPNDESDSDYIDLLAGSPKTQEQWGVLIENIPNNIGNTFTSDPKTTRTISWQSSLNRGELVMEKSHFASTKIYTDGWYFHRVNLSGLEPGKTYRYIVGSSGTYSPVYSFTTESASTSGGFSILHITDPQIDLSVNDQDAVFWKRVMDNAISKFSSVAFVVNTGDIVEDFNTAAIPYYFDYAQEKIASYAFVYSMGNNDLLSWFGKYFYYQGNHKDNVLYSFDYGNVHFVNVDSNTVLSGAHLTWLENDLASTDKKWKVAMTHDGAYGRNGRDTAVARLFDTYNVDLVLSGHNHFYARSKPIDHAGNVKQNGTVWTIPNASGSKFNSKSGAAFLAKDSQPNLPMYSILTFTGSNILLNAYTVNSAGQEVSYDSYAWR